MYVFVLKREINLYHYFMGQEASKIGGCQAWDLRSDPDDLGHMDPKTASNLWVRAGRWHTFIHRLGGGPGADLGQMQRTMSSSPSLLPLLV